MIMSMIEEKNNKWYSNKKVLVSLITVLLVLVVGMAFAYYFAILRGENVNTALTGGASLIYTEPTNGVETIQASDYVGMTNENSYDFTISANASNTTRIEYGIYLEEVEGNTISPSDVRVFLTDQNNIPYDGFYTSFASYDSMNTFVDNEGNFNFYDTVYDEYDYSITDADGVEVISSSMSGGASPKQVMYQFYGESLGLNDGDYLYVKELRYNETEDIEEERCIQYNYDNYGENADFNVVEDSNCEVLFTYGENNKLILQSTSDYSSVYTMTTVSKEVYTVIVEEGNDNLIEYNGTIYDYIAKEQLKKAKPKRQQ